MKEVKVTDIKINYNDIVKVKLTPVGIKTLEDRREGLNAMIMTRGGKPVGPYEPKVDKDGYTKFPLSILMNNFGQMFGNAGEPPFEPEMIIVKT